MLFMHEVHEVRGRAEDDFEAAFPDGWMPMLGTGDKAIARGDRTQALVVSGDNNVARATG